MAPKKKGGKKQADDWENDLGETIEPATQATENGENTANGDGEDEAAGGGLLAAIRKNKDRRKKKGKVDNDFVEGEDPAQSETVPEPDLNNKAPEEATFDDEDVFAGAANKKGKGGKKQTEKPADDDDDQEGGGMKSKKEKEREKKEREKARKKEQASKKKTTAPTPAPAAEKVPEKVVEAVPEDAPTPAVDDKGAKKSTRKVPAHLAAIQKQQEALAKQREENARQAAEEQALEAEKLRLEAEEEKKKAEVRQRKKEKEREKKEQLRKEGKLLTDAERKRQHQQQLRMQQMLDSGAGVQVAGLGGEGDEKKKPAFDKKKKKGPQKHEVDLEAAAEKARLEAEAAAAERERKAKEAEAAAAAAAAAAPTGQAAEESDLEDWEKAAAADDDVKDSWDADSDEEAAAAANGAATNGDQAQKTLPVRGSKAAGDEDSGSESDSEEDSSEDEELTAAKQAEARRKALAAERKKKAHEEALAARSAENLRSPICCILGHVDTGKTKLLDKIRQTNVQEGEAGGITQQIGATYFPTEALTTKIAPVNEDGKFNFKVPGLLVIDTPGHESFSNLRSRGSSLCNIAILVVDIMHGLEPQTLESMKLLRDRKTPFIVALNKIDRLYGWKPIANNGFQASLAFQNKSVHNEFKDKLEKTKLAFAEQGFNAELYNQNKNMARYVSLVPTSAHTGEGIPDMLKLLITLTQERMTSSLMYLSEVEGTVLEVKKIEGLGTTIDVVLSNGVLREGDRIVICGLEGAIVTNVRALLTPAPLKELRLKSQYVHNKEAKASLGVKIAANDLDKAVAGSRLMVVGPDDDESELEEEVMSDLQQLLSKVDKQQRGVSVHASTLGSLEALLEFLKQMKIPVGNIGLGTVFKTEVMRAGTMLEKNLKEYAVMLCFDVAVDKDAAKYAEENGVTVFQADIIYHLFDAFQAFCKKLAEEKKEESKLDAVFPAVLSPLQVFNKKDPIVIGVDVIEGNLRLETPIAAVKHNPVTGVKEIVKLGRV